MSHFSVLVCLAADTDLTKLDETLSDLMERWNENREVEPYRDYEEASPEDYWWVSSVRRGAANHRELQAKGAAALARERIEAKLPPDSIEHHDWERAARSVEEMASGWADDATWAARLGEHPTWETVVRLHNEKYHPGNEVAVAGDASDSERLHYDAESGRAYTISTLNPERKWDYWRIGGRWRGYFPVRELVPNLVFAKRSWDSSNESSPQNRRCDGGPIAALDFEAMRAEAESEARARYATWEQLLVEHSPAQAWSRFCALAEVGEITWDQARQQYNDQPLIRASRKALDNDFGPCPLEEFLPPRDEYVLQKRRGAVPGYALVTLEREWVAPGRMGWFGVSSDGPGERTGYHVAVNQYLDQVDPATILVVLDCHI